MVQGVRSIIGRNKIDGDVQNSVVNAEAKELTCTTHGHELGSGASLLEGRGVPGEGGQREKLG